VITSLELSFKYEETIQLPDNLYRVKHDIELPAPTIIKGIIQHGIGWDILFRKMKRGASQQNFVNWRKNVPEVFVMNPIHKVKMTEDWQRLMWDLFLWGAPNVGTGEYGMKKWTELYGCHRAFDNNNGFECKKDPPHGPFANYILRKDLGAPLPAFDKPRVCGGATIRATLRDGKYWIDTLTKPIDIQQLIREPWHYFHATTVHEDGTIGKFPQGDGSPVLVPLVATEPVHYPIEYLERVDRIVDPYWIPS